MTKRKLRLTCHACGRPIEDLGLAMLFWETDGYGGPVTRWAITHKDVETHRRSCDPGYALSAELGWFVEPGRVAHVRRGLSTYRWPPADALALCALFQVAPPAEFASTGGAE